MEIPHCRVQVATSLLFVDTVLMAGRMDLSSSMLKLGDGG